MKKLLITVATTGMLTQTAFSVGTEAEYHASIRDAISSVKGYISDGSTTDRKRKCNQVSTSGIKTQSGLYSDWKSKISKIGVSTDFVNQRFVVTVDATCNRKRQQKAGCGGYVEDTKWYTYNGRLVFYAAVEGGGIFQDELWSYKSHQDNFYAQCGAGLTNAIIESFDGKLTGL